MKRLIAFFEIPAADFNRAVKFYEVVMDAKLNVMDCGHEKMAFFSDGICDNCGAISMAENFKPSKDGVLISLSCNDIEKTLAAVTANGGQVGIPKTQIESEGAGFFATFFDSEGNRLGLWSEQ